MKQHIHINLPIKPHEVPDLRAAVGWERREQDYPSLLERCQFYAGARDEAQRLIVFGYISGMGLQHGYLEDILVHPDYRYQQLGTHLVHTLLQQAKHHQIEIVTCTFTEEHASFYQKCGLTLSKGGVWRS